MVSEYFPHPTIHELSQGSQRFYACNGYIHVDTLDEAVKYAPGKLGFTVPTRNDRKADRDDVIYQNRVRMNPIAPRLSYDFKMMLRCLEVIDEVKDEEGMMFSMLTEFAGVVDVEVLATRYVLHFDSAHRHYIMGKLAEYQVPHTRNIDGHTTEVLRMIKQPLVRGEIRTIHPAMESPGNKRNK